jgi:chloramphenicol O-acetyltransferase type A
LHEIDLPTWPRRAHFEVYRSYDDPHFNLCAPVDLTIFQPAVKANGLSFTVALVYLLARAANGLPEFRQRIRGERVIEHEVVHPSTTILAEGDLFSFCTFPYEPDFKRFAVQAGAAMARVRQRISLADEPGQDDLLFMTGIPWVAFTSLKHPIPSRPVDSVPRIAWGKYTRLGERLEMPLSVQVHHALMDGVHLGRYYQAVQALLDNPDEII